MKKDLLAWLGAFVLVTVILLYVVGVQALGWTLWAPWEANRRTEVVRNTNQYVTTQEEKILGLVNQYDQLETYEQTPEIDRQQHNLVLQMCDAAAKIDKAYVPAQAQPLMREEGCWS